MIEQPFTPDLLLSNPDAAREFLVIFEHKSYNLLDDWTQLKDNDLCRYAADRLMDIHRELETVMELKARNELH